MHERDYPVNSIAQQDIAYPKILRVLSDAPRMLYVRGELAPLLELHLVAIVGTRRCTPYGKRAAAFITRDLVRAGVCIVSGMAFGIDAIAHQTALEENGKTIAVLGTGVDDNSLYPRAHVGLAKKILAQGGVVMSEYPPGTPGYKDHFPARNRIVAGLCRMTVVVEAPFKSGARITARLALDYNREVGAVPGPLFAKQSEGTNDLIAQGALCVRSADDILQALNIEKKNRFVAEQSFASTEERTIAQLLDKAEEPLSLDKIIEQSTLNPSQALSVISMLQLQGRIQDAGGGKYIWIH
jgi:DNA processing protein